MPQSLFFSTNGIQLHCLDHGGSGPALLLMPGLTSNAYCFDGLVAAGLIEAFRVIAVDLRGRGLSDYPALDYGMEAHAADIIGLLDALGLPQAIVGGHSFGGLLSFYVAARFPSRVERLVVMDAAGRMHLNTIAMLEGPMSRLGKSFDSFETYLERAKTAPFLDFWDETMLAHTRADVRDNPDGSVTQPGHWDHMMEAITTAIAQPWDELLPAVRQPALLVNATGTYTLDAPLVPQENALATVAALPAGRFLHVPGNHQTMLYGDGAKQIATAIAEFAAPVYTTDD